MFKLTKLLLLALCIFLPGCATLLVKQAQEQMSTNFNSVMGLTEEEVIIKLGSPQNIEQIGDLKIYYYYQSFGSRSNAYANAAYGIYGFSNTWEAYDKTELVFKDGRAISWKGYVQR